MLASFAVFGLVLAALGLYASVAYTVSQSRREIAVRMALGAQHADVRNLFLRRAFGPSAAGLAAGAVASAWLASYIRTLLFGVSATDPVSIVLAAFTMFATGLLAGYFPAVSAARTDPSTTLRYE